jgi:hypothetical protein
VISAFFFCSEANRAFRSLLASWKVSGQIAMSAGTSRSDRPFTTTVRSNFLTRTA